MIDSILIICGLILAGFSFQAWQNTGFQIEGWSANSLFEGRMTFWSMVGGLAVIGYSIFDILIFRKTKTRIKRRDK